MNGLRDLIVADSNSVRNFAKKRGFKDPISLKSLITMQSEVSSGLLHLKAGDVEGWAAMRLLSNGQCEFSGHFHDNGTLFGDDYTVVIGVQHPQVGALVRKKQGSLKAKANADWNDPSFELWVQSNWATLIDGQTTFHCKLHVEWGIDVSDLAYLLVFLGIVGGAADCFNDPNTSKSYGKDENGNAYARCSW